MTRFVLVFCCISMISLTSFAQKNKEVIIMDFVKITTGKKAEAMYYYENNWKLYRDAAVKNKIIKSYELVEARPDSLNNFDLILITVYEDSVQHAKSEENFAPLLEALRPAGPVLLNEIKPNDFRKNVFFKIVKPVFYSPARKRN
ncbi:MAG: hypothetical protein IPH68_03435 [Chitinophagaceae bacterium]|nr:hypothetical protein [Chitinophagaceae bacterium]MBK7121926.1 hypothetical protein [Chitinophagaceae bacterium]